MTSTRDMALGRWPGILQALGLEEQYLTGKHTPCPMCGGRDRFRFTDRHGTGAYFCNQCGPGHGMDLALHLSGKSFKETAADIDRLIQTVPPATRSVNNPRKVRKRLMRISERLRTVCADDPVGRYLASRGLGAAPTGELRFHPSLPYYEDGRELGVFPAMVAAFRDGAGGLETMHVTYLTQLGTKADVPSPRKMMGVQRGLAGGAIRLTPVAAHLGLAEGIETALSVTALTGLPCWAGYSAHSIETFQPPEGVTELTIFADADADYVGQAAALNAARRLSKAGYRVHVPPFLPIGTDYNDLLIKEAAACPSA